MRAFFSPKVSPWYIYVALAIVEIRNTWGLHRRAATGARMARRSRSPGRSGPGSGPAVRGVCGGPVYGAFVARFRTSVERAWHMRHRGTVLSLSRIKRPSASLARVWAPIPHPTRTLTHFQHFQLARTPDKKPPPSLLWVQGV